MKLKSWPDETNQRVLWLERWASQIGIENTEKAKGEVLLLISSIRAGLEMRRPS